MLIGIRDKPSELFSLALKAVLDGSGSLDLFEKKLSDPDSNIPEFANQFEKGWKTLGTLDRENATLLAAQLPYFHKRLVSTKQLAIEAHLKHCLTYKLVGIKTIESIWSDRIPLDYLRQVPQFATASNPIYKPWDFSKACWLKSYELYKEIHQIDENLRKMYPTHNMLWLLAMSSKCQRQITMAGLARSPISGLNTKPPGKNKAYKERRRYFDLLWDPTIARESDVVQPYDPTCVRHLQNLDTLLDQLGSKIASRNDAFDKGFWKPYVAAELALFREVNNNPDIQLLSCRI